MNEERRARWVDAIRKSRGGEPVSLQEHYALLREGLFHGLSKVDAEEEARYVVRYLLSGEDLSDIPPRGPREAQNWFAMRAEWGAARQTEKLRNMIAASRHELDSWMALNHIAIRIQEERRWWPAMLADWDIAVRRGTWVPVGPGTTTRQDRPHGDEGGPGGARGPGASRLPGSAGPAGQNRGPGVHLTPLHG